MGYILIIGAKSDIAKAVARYYAQKGFNLYLAGRNINILKGFSSDLGIRYSVDIQMIELDILNREVFESFYNQLTIKPIGLISAVGYLGDQFMAQSNLDETHKIINTNYTGIVSLINLIANDFEKRKKGFIVGISSVAGDRGRKSNYIYGASKAAFTAYLSGLRNRLYSSDVHVLTVKPGFVKTSMTKKLNLPKILTILPNQVAKEIYLAQQKKKNVIYTMGLWKWIMLIIRNIPEYHFKKMNL